MTRWWERHLYFRYVFFSHTYCHISCSLSITSNVNSRPWIKHCADALYIVLFCFDIGTIYITCFLRLQIVLDLYKKSTTMASAKSSCVIQSITVSLFNEKTCCYFLLIWYGTFKLYIVCMSREQNWIINKSFFYSAPYFYRQ